MSKVEMMRAFVNQRLTVAADEIFELFERTIAEYEERLESISQEKNRQRKLLDAVYNPEVQLQRADVQQLLVILNKAPAEQREWSSRLDREDPKPPFIKQEQKEVWTSRDRVQLQEKEVNTSPFTVKLEEDEEEKAQYSQLHGSQTEADREGTEADGGACGASEPACPLQTAIHNNTANSSEAETDDSSDWERIEDPQSGLKTLENTEVTGGDVECKTKKTSAGASGRAKRKKQKSGRAKQKSGRAKHKKQKQKITGIQNGDKPSSSFICGKRSPRKKSVTVDKIHKTKEKSFSCSVCKASFSAKQCLVIHMRTHTKKKQYKCSVCGKGFPQKTALMEHMALHTGEKPFSCSSCSKTFTKFGNLRRHMTRFTGEKPFSCSSCNKSYTRQSVFRKHKCVGDTSRNLSFTDAW